ncbi:MAG: acetoin utilization protein AcuC [Planctomycetota bacterium]
MGSGKAVFIHGAELERFRYPPEHPFRPERAAMTFQLAQSMGLLSGEGIELAAPTTATREDLERFHSARYLDALARADEGHLDIDALQMGIGTPDCPAFRGMYAYAALACGGTLLGARRILAGEAQVAFNPSGGYHHAQPELASGFCYINDQALACLALASTGKRVLYLDADAHHGDGVQNAFYDRADVMTISFHESGRTLWPGTGFEDEIGTGEGRGYSVNVPLPAGTHDEAYLEAFREIALPLLGAFRPDVISLELGLDGLAGDPLTHLALSDAVHAEIVARVLECGCPVLATGGGGYQVENTVRGWTRIWGVLVRRAASTGEEGKGPKRGISPREKELRRRVEAGVRETIRAVKANVFAIHGL